jgi:hypothetical protein
MKYSADGGGIRFGDEKHLERMVTPLAAGKDRCVFE